MREQLRKIKALIHNPEHWWQGTYAVNQWGHGVPPLDPTACKWCLLGAISHIAPNPVAIYDIVEYLTTFAEPLGYHQLVEAADPFALEDAPIVRRYLLTQINDRLGFDAVHKLLDMAIQKTV